ncbi:MAG: prepilin-type N-terminal cleavage/methylation domain-containing protein [Candidatus Gastranaerophilaceae bacterium]
MKKAFTLAEMMVVMLILSIVLAAMLRSDNKKQNRPIITLEVF